MILNMKTLKFSKEHFKLFDFFGVCEYFENDFNYDEKIKLVLKHGSGNGNDGGFKPEIEKVIHLSTDTIASINEEIIGVSGMKIDRKFYSSFSEKVSVDPNIQIYIRNQDEDGLIGYLQREIFNKPIEFFTLEKIERALGLKRHLTIREVAHNIITGHEEYKTKEEILNDEFENFILINKDDIELHPETIPALREIFVAYLVDAGIREAIKHKQYNILINSPLKESVRQIKSEKIKNMPVLDYIPYYVTTNAINCERFYA